MTEAGFASVGDRRLHYECHGTGEPVLFIPGLGNGLHCWDRQVSLLGAAFRCITYDPRDCGASDVSPDSYGIADLAADAVGLLQALGLDQAHVVGWSMGGAVAQEMAIGWPGAVRRLALIATYADGDARGAANLRGWSMLRRRLSRREYHRVTAPWVYSPSEYEQPGLIEEALERALSSAEQPQQAFERQVEATVTHHAGDHLDRIKAPTLLVFGGDDALTPLRFAHGLKAGITGAELVVLDGAGHALAWTRAGELAQLLTDFLRQPAGDAGGKRTVAALGNL